MIVPSGRGMFVWQLHRCEGGNLAAIIAKAQASGFSFLVMHEIALDTQVYAKLKAAGLQVGFCFYSVPGVSETARQVIRAKMHRDAGADFICVDAEEFWERLPDGAPGWRGPEAADFARQLRASLGPDCWIGNAGAWQWPEAHPNYPDREFGAVFDAAMPERYWTEFPPAEPYAKSIATGEKQWSLYPDVQGYRSVFPIGSAYGANGEIPAGHQPLEIADLADFDGRYATRAYWDWLHCPRAAWDWFAANAP